MILELITLVVFEVQANDLISPSIHPSSPPIRFPLPSQLDPSQLDDARVPCPLHNCLKLEINICKKRQGSFSSLFRKCIVKRFFNYMYIAKKESCDVEVYKNAKECIDLCLPRAQVQDNTGVCLLCCFEENIKGKAL